MQRNKPHLKWVNGAWIVYLDPREAYRTLDMMAAEAYCRRVNPVFVEESLTTYAYRFYFEADSTEPNDMSFTGSHLNWKPLQ